MAIASVPSESVLAKKNGLLAMQGEWRTVRDPKTGQRVIVMPNLTETRVYYVEPAGKACSCMAGQHGTLCAHRLAAIERANHDALAAWESTGWERIPAEDAIAVEAIQERARAEAERPARKSYEDLYPSNQDIF